MKTGKITVDLAVGVILVLVGSYFFWLASKMNPMSAVFPQIVIGAFIILSLGMAIQGYYRGKRGSENDSKLSFSEIKIPLLIFALVTGYVVALEYAGFYIATFLFIPIVAGFYKNNKPLQIIATTVGVISFIHLLFVVQLKLMLP